MPSRFTFLDLHCHTVASGHAFSTLEETAQAAARAGLTLAAITDHGPAMPHGAHEFFFWNLRVLPKKIAGVRIWGGCEANVLDYGGKLDLEDGLLAQLDWNIASFHPPCIAPASESEVTRCLLVLMGKRHVHMIGHPGDPRYPFHLREVVAASKETGTLLEINNSSLRPISARPGGSAGIRSLLEECGRQDAPVIVSSDAHIACDVGCLTEAEALIREMGFPEKLVLNRSEELFKEYRSSHDKTGQ